MCRRYVQLLSTKTADFHAHEFECHATRVCETTYVAFEFAASSKGTVLKAWHAV